MRIWGLVIFLLGLVLFKGYLIRGVAQASDSRSLVWAYGILSLGSLLLGFFIFRMVFNGGQINLTLWQNISTALMVSIIICEIFLGIFFLADDVVWGAQALIDKMGFMDLSSSSRRRWIKTVGLGVTALPFSAYLYGITKGKYSYKVFHRTITFPDLPPAFDGFKIAQFSDFHAGSFDQPNAVQQGLLKLQAENPDLILFTGDLVNDKADEVLPFKHMLQALSAPFGKFAVLGNHDYPGSGHETEHTGTTRPAKVAQIEQHHQDIGFQLLNNAQVSLQKGEAAIRLIGVENWGTRFVKYGDLTKACEGCQDSDFKILLSHDPSHWDAEVLPFPQKIHLTLSGHTHGLQMGIELPHFKWSPIKYVYPRWAGLYQFQQQYLYVNRGFGFIGFAGRVGIRPEITLLTLRRG